MIGERTKALLSAASAIFAGVASAPDYVPGKEEALVQTCTNVAYALLAAIEQREKANLSPREVE